MNCTITKICIYLIYNFSNNSYLQEMKSYFSPNFMRELARCYITF